MRRAKDGEVSAWMSRYAMRYAMRYAVMRPPLRSGCANVWDESRPKQPPPVGGIGDAHSPRLAGVDE